MTGFAAAIVTIVVAWNPFAILPAEADDAKQRAIGWAIGAAVIVLVAAATDPILSLLSVSAPTLQTAAGSVVALFGARWLLGPAPKPAEPGGIGLAATVVTLAPPAVIAALAVTAEEGWVAAMIGVGIALLATIATARSRLPETACHTLRRATGAAAIAVGAALIFAGIRSV